MSPTRCPHCAALLSPVAVQEGRCGACGGELPSLQASPPTEERLPWRAEDEKELAARSDRDRWLGVRAGLGWLNVGMVLSMICQFLSLIPNLMLAKMPRYSDTAETLATVSTILQVVPLIILLVGMTRSSLAPPGSGLRGFGLSSLICTFVMIVFLAAGLVATWLLLLTAQPVEEIMVGLVLALLAILLAALLGVVASLLFTMYLRGVACRFGDSSLGNTFIGYFILGMVLLVAFVSGMVVLAVVDPRRAGDANTLFLASSVITVTGTVLLIWLVAMLNRLRRLIGGASLATPPGNK